MQLFLYARKSHITFLEFVKYYTCTANLPYFTKWTNLDVYIICCQIASAPKKKTVVYVTNASNLSYINPYWTGTFIQLTKCTHNIFRTIKLKKFKLSLKLYL